MLSMHAVLLVAASLPPHASCMLTATPPPLLLQVGGLWRGHGRALAAAGRAVGAACLAAGALPLPPLAAYSHAAGCWCHFPGGEFVMQVWCNPAETRRGGACLRPDASNSPEAGCRQLWHAHYFVSQACKAMPCAPGDMSSLPPRLPCPCPHLTATRPLATTSAGVPGGLHAPARGAGLQKPDHRDLRQPVPGRGGHTAAAAHGPALHAGAAAGQSRLQVGGGVEVGAGVGVGGGLGWVGVQENGTCCSAWGVGQADTGAVRLRVPQA